MRLVIPALAGLALALVATGLPPVRAGAWARRVEPYLRGMGGLPLVRTNAPAGLPPWKVFLQASVRRLGLAGDPSVAQRLLAAGRTQSVESFRVDQIVWSLGAAALILSVAVIARLIGDAALYPIAMLVLIGTASGWILVDLRLSRAVGQRRDLVRSQMPVALDLLTLSVMAGESVPQAFARVGTMLDGEVGAEFSHVFGSVRSGASIANALEDLPSRLPDPSAARLVDALCTAMERGAPLAETLRAQAEDLRDARRRELLELGGKREILMLVPVVFLILPTVVAFTLLPGLVSLDLLVP